MADRTGQICKKDPLAFKGEFMDYRPEDGDERVGRSATGQLPGYLLLQDTCHDFIDIHPSVPTAVKSKSLW